MEQREEQVKLATYRRGWNDGKKPDENRPAEAQFGPLKLDFIDLLLQANVVVFDGQPLCIT